MTSRKINVSRAEVDSAMRKVNLTLGVSGGGDEQINVLLNALAHVTVKEGVDMTAVIHALTEAYLEYDKLQDEEGDDDD